MPAPKSKMIMKEIFNRMPERDIIEILCNSHHYTGWANFFGPISGMEPKIENPLEKYIFTTFAYGSGMGATQAAKHIRSQIGPHLLTWVNRRHVTLKSLDRALTALINCCNDFWIIKAWGDGSSCAADGTLRNIYEENLLSEYHIRYGSTGGIAYHHVSDTYIALFSTLISCGVWEAVEIIEALLKNESEIKPNTIHADTQGQSNSVFALSFLLGINLMPRIRNWKDLTLFRPYKEIRYKNIDCLFSGTINWELIEKHWQDLMQVILSIKAGKISTSLLLRKLTSYSTQNKLYLAFQELGRVIRTLFLLEYISDVELREKVTETTNKVENYHQLTNWLKFGSEHVIVASNDNVEQEKAIKYNTILANAVILQNISDMTDTLYQLSQDGHLIGQEDLQHMSPYLTHHIKRFGDYFIDLEKIPKDIRSTANIKLW
jgi:TnpA family transposase